MTTIPLSGTADAASHGRTATPTTSTGEALLALPASQPTFVALAIVALALFTLTQVDIAQGQTSALLRQFDTGNEANVATWFSSVLWLAAGLLAFAIGAAGRQLHDRGATRWLVLGGAFTLLALDEVAQLHEQTVGPLMDAVKQITGAGQGSARVLAVGCIAFALAAFAASLLPWMRTLPAETRAQLLLAGTIFVGGSVALEVLSRLYETPYLSPFEELAEMLGGALLVTALLPYVHRVVARPPAAEPSGGAPAA